MQLPSEPLVLLICGTRALPLAGVVRLDIILQAVARARPDTTIVHGAASGVDRWAGRFAKAHGLQVREFPADWEKYGKGAGHIRNQQMLDEGRPHLVYALHTDPGLGKGTRDMVRRARAAGLPVFTEVLDNGEGVM
jgi:hypothetical protein